MCSHVENLSSFRQYQIMSALSHEKKKLNTQQEAGIPLNKLRGRVYLFETQTRCNYRQ